jgi:hypothetical protein
MEQLFNYQQIIQHFKAIRRSVLHNQCRNSSRETSPTKQTFSSIYRSSIVLIHKNNYTPRLGQAVDILGGLAEGVSD